MSEIKLVGWRAECIFSVEENDATTVSYQGLILHPLGKWIDEHSPLRAFPATFMTFDAAMNALIKAKKPNITQKTTELWEVLVPCLMDGKPVSTKHHKEWDKRVKKLSGGLTILKPGKGQWVDDNTGVTHEDRVIPVRIACNRKTIDKIIDITISHYRQLAVMAYCVSADVIIKRKDNGSSAD